MLKGPTLGEEFCDLLPVARGNPWRSVGLTRVALLSALIAVQPTALFHAARRLFPSVPPHDVTGNVHKVVLCLLFLFEAYGTLPHRLTRTRFLSLQPSQALAQGDGAPGSYLTLGLVLLVELIVRLWRYCKLRDSEKKKIAEEKVAMEASSSDDEEAAKTGRCMLCLSHRKCPTATQCGHIFCWSCIAEWIRSNPSDAICPFCRQRITAPSLVPLFFYVAGDSPTVGTAEDS
ncbi:peroxin-10 [Strigomonas culicis]|uniref:RING-type E3 ubiquitin transferase n=1 Tax=Strigomonas culicis TaxID=28005 RepID=S9U8Q1_9TRYP|nr:peroxin-10 [Strigomonas culicis]EPY29630.1 peroxin-10 [Strigomonas culicis]|eukprot:EPY25139.1 peroxin-10 [Strigomonas culicis]